MSEQLAKQRDDAEKQVQFFQQQQRNAQTSRDLIQAHLTGLMNDAIKHYEQQERFWTDEVCRLNQSIREAGA